MDAFLALALALLSLVAAAVVLRSFGSRYRVARLIGAAPAVTVAEALALARAGRPAYVRITGRIDGEDEFEDADHRPLVFRRTRVQVRRGSRWDEIETSLEIVPFAINEGLDRIVIDGPALGEGLVVVRRESEGHVGDLGDRVPDDVPDDWPARVIVEQVSSIEHAIVIGVPVVGEDGQVRLGAGSGRPLILSTLEPAEAMRTLAAGDRIRPRLAAGLLIAGVILVAVALALFVIPGDALAASPTPSPIAGSDTRSAGEGPGFVGAILPAVAAVIVIALVAIIGTTIYVRLTGGRASDEG